jgi:hypothetical protein
VRLPCLRGANSNYLLQTYKNREQNGAVVSRDRACGGCRFEEKLIDDESSTLCWFTMANVGAETPLNRAYRDGNSTVAEILRLIDADPEALKKQDSRRGYTPLHWPLHLYAPSLCMHSRCVY